MQNDNPSISDQARDAAGGVPDPNWGAQGTSGEAPPRTSTVYPPNTDPMLTPAHPEAPKNTVNQSVNGPLAPSNPAPEVPQFATEAQLVSDASAAPSTESRVGELEKDVQKIASAMGTIFEKLDQVISGQQPPQAPAEATPGMPTNTGQLGQFQPPAGVAAPAAPTPHQPGVQPPVARQSGPAIPAAVPLSEQATPQQKVARIPDDETNLTVAEYVEKHFRMRDQSINEMATLLRLEPREVTDILKELGYQFPDGA